MVEAMRLVVAIVNRGKGEEIAEYDREDNIDYSFLAYGRGTVRGEMLNMLGLGTVDKDVVATLLPQHAVKTHLAGLAGLLKLKRPGQGIAFSIPLTALNALVARDIQAAYPNEEEKEVKPLSAKFGLILIVVEAGFVDQVMETAKEAGATGGTLLHARGIGREEGENFLGAALQAEKEVISILAERHTHKQIMEAVNKTCGVTSPAKGVVFSLPVDEIVGIG